jgi:hypothetical protein
LEIYPPVFTKSEFGFLNMQAKQRKHSRAFLDGFGYVYIDNELDGDVDWIGIVMESIFMLYKAFYFLVLVIRGEMWGGLWLGLEERDVNAEWRLTSVDIISQVH